METRNRESAVRGVVGDCDGDAIDNCSLASNSLELEAGNKIVPAEHGIQINIKQHHHSPQVNCFPVLLLLT